MRKIITILLLFLLIHTASAETLLSLNFTSDDGSPIVDGSGTSEIIDGEYYIAGNLATWSFNEQRVGTLNVSFDTRYTNSGAIYQAFFATRTPDSTTPAQGVYQFITNDYYFIGSFGDIIYDTSVDTNYTFKTSINMDTGQVDYYVDDTLSLTHNYTGYYEITSLNKFSAGKSTTTYILPLYIDNLLITHTPHYTLNTISSSPSTIGNLLTFNLTNITESNVAIPYSIDDTAVDAGDTLTIAYLDNSSEITSITASSGYNKLTIPSTTEDLILYATAQQTTSTSGGSSGSSTYYPPEETTIIETTTPPTTTSYTQYYTLLISFLLSILILFILENKITKSSLLIVTLSVSLYATLNYISIIPNIFVNFFNLAGTADVIVSLVFVSLTTIVIHIISEPQNTTKRK